MYSYTQSISTNVQLYDQRRSQSKLQEISMQAQMKRERAQLNPVLQHHGNAMATLRKFFKINATQFIRASSDINEKRPTLRKLKTLIFEKIFDFFNIE